MSANRMFNVLVVFALLVLLAEMALTPGIAAAASAVGKSSVALGPCLAQPVALGKYSAIDWKVERLEALAASAGPVIRPQTFNAQRCSLAAPAIAPRQKTNLAIERKIQRLESSGNW